MIKCKLCEYVTLEEFSEKAQKHSNNLEKRKKISQATALSMHVISFHNLTVEQYTVTTEYNNIIPKCACGFCNEKPTFYRGKFKKYAIGHMDFKFREKEYLKKNGQPKCLNCNSYVDFFRGNPRFFCS